MFGLGNLRHYPADGRLHIDGGVMAFFRQSPGQHNVAIQDRPRGVRDRILLVIAFRQYGIECSNRATTRPAIAGTLHQLRQFGEDRRRIALGGWRLADGQGNFPLGLCIAGQ